MTRFKALVIPMGMTGSMAFVMTALMSDNQDANEVVS